MMLMLSQDKMQQHGVNIFTKNFTSCMSLRVKIPNKTVLLKWKQLGGGSELNERLTIYAPS